MRERALTALSALSCRGPQQFPQTAALHPPCTAGTVHGPVNGTKPSARVPSEVTQQTHSVLRTPNKGKGRVVKAILPCALLRCQPSSGGLVTFEKVRSSDVLLGSVSLATGCGRYVRDAEKEEFYYFGCGSRPVYPSERAWPTAYAN